jgi:hypothetical protein
MKFVELNSNSSLIEVMKFLLNPKFYEELANILIQKRIMLGYFCFINLSYLLTLQDHNILRYINIFHKISIVDGSPPNRKGKLQMIQSPIEVSLCPCVGTFHGP